MKLKWSFGKTVNGSYYWYPLGIGTNDTTFVIMFAVITLTIRFRKAK